MNGDGGSSVLPLRWLLLGRIFCGVPVSPPRLLPPVGRACSCARMSAGLVEPTGRKRDLVDSLACWARCRKWSGHLLVGPLCDNISQIKKKVVLNFKAV